MFKWMKRKVTTSTPLPPDTIDCGALHVLLYLLPGREAFTILMAPLSKQSHLRSLNLSQNMVG